jgi:hypothetical protein
VSTQITSAFVNQYASNVTLLSQQKASRLRAAVRVEPVNGEIGYFDSIGSVAMVERASRHADTPFTEIPHSRRRVVLRDFEASEIIDAQDRVRTLADPQSFYVQAFAAAAGRRMDDEIVAAFFANAQAGKAGEVTVGLPAGNTIAHDYVETGAAASSSLTVAKLRRAKELLDAGEAGTDPDEPRFVACSSREVTFLLRSTEVTSTDFNSVRALVQGEIDTFMGFRFIRTERLQLNGSGHRRVAAWVQSGMLLGVGEEPVANIAPDPTKSFNTRVHYRASFGAVRMEEAKVVEIVCNPAP